MDDLDLNPNDHDVDTWSDAMLNYIIEMFEPGRDPMPGQTKHRIKKTEDDLRNALRDFYQMHI